VTADNFKVTLGIELRELCCGQPFRHSLRPRASLSSSKMPRNRSRQLRASEGRSAGNPRKKERHGKILAADQARNTVSAAMASNVRITTTSPEVERAAAVKPTPVNLSKRQAFESAEVGFIEMMSGIAGAIHYDLGCHELSSQKHSKQCSFPLGVSMFTSKGAKNQQK
jgi:hypothetical protein